MKVVAGCPVSNREWILDQWILFLGLATSIAGITDLHILLAGSDADEEPSLAAVKRVRPDLPLTYIHTHEEPRIVNPEIPDLRDWGKERFVDMTRYRNALLETVREMGPDYYLSVDSDMLLHPRSIVGMLEAADPGACGSKAYLTKHSNMVTYANLLPTGGLKRSNVKGLLPSVDVLMAIKLMSPKAYHVDYCYNSQGEDIGWSIDARKAGCVLAFDGRVANRHVRSRDNIWDVDPLLPSQQWDWLAEYSEAFEALRSEILSQDAP